MGRFLFALFFLIAAAGARAQQPALRAADRVRLAEAFRLAEAVQDSVWPGWSRAPFAVLLVTPEHEFLIRHPDPSADFRPLGYDALLGSDVLARPRVHPPHLLATFPAVGGVPTVVVGQPERTGKSSTLWTLTLLHEHFHQLQLSRPGYYAAVERLDLARGDRSGMWMLDYPFPYDSSAVRDRFGRAAERLRGALGAIGGAEFPERLAGYRAARERLRETLPADDYRYLSFQLWQEGVARYVEYAVARAARAYEPTDAFRRLDDFLPFDRAADSVRAGIEAGLAGRLDRVRRDAFYPAGAAEALLLDAAAPDWKRRYFEEMFFLERYF